ncbi:MAG TPA: M28 family peptidase [Gemmatimonadales bacterium]|nr:M28 family peptidase [Gemmatimonadales bacterium]
MSRSFRTLASLAVCLAATTPAVQGQSSDTDIARLTGAMLGETPMLKDLEVVTDRYGGRATGSDANRLAFEWALGRFREAGVDARLEPFQMPGLWLERSASATVRGTGVAFSPRIAALPFSMGTPAAGSSGALLDGGRGDSAAFAALGATAEGAWILVEQEELKDIDGLFREYAEAGRIEALAWRAHALGVVYMGSRPHDLLYRHNMNLGFQNHDHLGLVMERDGALRALRLLRSGVRLSLTAVLDLQRGPAYESHNVVGEIRGTSHPDEIVLIGAHYDSWDLGGGALDNGANAMMILDIARQMKRLGIRPGRTIRFVLWSGEELGMYGSWGYTRTHAAELDKHVMTTSIDIGTGRITGFFTGGRDDLLAPVDQALLPAGGLGPFSQVNAPIVGTDNYDFMLEGVANLVANQESANYGPNYHARSDEFGAVDQQQLRLNAAIIAAMTLRFAEMPVTWSRQSRADVEKLVATTDLKAQMEQFGMWDDWANGVRGRKRP